jgi:hypothetical protein
MVSFISANSSKKQQTYFGNRINKRASAGRIVIPKVDSDKHPLLKDGVVMLNASYNVPEAVREMIDLGYIRDKELSNIETNVWVKDGRPYILHRGSTNAKDFLISDVLLGLNLSDNLDPRLEYVKKINKKAKDKYKMVPYHLGHSLGSFYAEASADPLAYVLTYNKGTSPFHIKKDISPRQLDIRVKGDLVSFFNKYQNVNTITLDKGRKNFIDAHKLDNLEND